MILKLNQITFDWNTNDPIKSVVFVNKYQIKFFKTWEYHNLTCTEIQVGDRHDLLVTETPEEILALINGEKETCNATSPQEPAQDRSS